MKKIILIPLVFSSVFVHAATTPAITEPVKTIKITAEIDGVVDSYTKDIGESIGEKDVLVQLNNEKTSILKNITEMELEQLYTERDYYNTKLKRHDTLRKTNSLSESDYEDSLFNYNISKNKIKQKEYSLEQKIDDVENSTIYGINGFVVSERYIEEGQYVNVSTELYELVDVRKLHAAFDVDDSKLEFFNINDVVSVIVDDKTYQGFVKYKGHTIEKGHYGYPIIVEVDNSEGLIQADKTVLVQYEDIK